MSVPASVTVNPSSATDARSEAQSGFGGGLTFAFGGNPNLALLNAGGGTQSTLTRTALYVGAGVACAMVLLWLLKRRR